MLRRQLFVPAFALLCVFTFASASVRAAEPVDLSGKWRGTWVSCKDGHHGTLNARFCKISDMCYEVRFSGTFFVAVPFCFTVNLQVTGEQDGKVFLSGSHRLPLFGTFHFDGVATQCEFTATYTSCDDNGKFNLCR
jgi:hypothetical protein